MSAREAAAQRVEEAIGHRFERRGLLDRALTHSSLAKTTNDGRIVRDLERLEFLGDRVLGLLTAEELWRRYPEMEEGQMAPRLNALVRKETCADAARAWDLGPAIKLAKGEDRNGGRDRDSVLGDACEALLGALYVDGGLEAARRAYDTFWLRNFDRLAAKHAEAKTVLQEWAQEHGHGTPRYVDVSRKGPDHSPSFVVQVLAGKLEPQEGRGPSKRAAQTEAARAMLTREGVWSDD